MRGVDSDGLSGAEGKEDMRKRFTRKDVEGLTPVQLKMAQILLAVNGYENAMHFIGQCREAQSPAQGVLAL